MVGCPFVVHLGTFLSVGNMPAIITTNFKFSGSYSADMKEYKRKEKENENERSFKDRSHVWTQRELPLERISGSFVLEKLTKYTVDVLLARDLKERTFEL